MNLIDTHCHLDFPDFDRDREDAIERASEAGVIRIINIGSTLESCKKTLELTKNFGFIYGSVGIHPHYADSVDDELLGSLRSVAQEEKIVAIGEVGLDYYRNRSSRENQKNAFLRFVALSEELGLPLVIHSRNAMDDVTALLKKDSSGNRRGVFHCFSGSADDIDKILDMGFCISFTCNLTFKNARNLRSVARRVPMDRLLLETDAPFLAPQQFRGRRNEPAYLTHLLEALSEIKGLTREEVADTTTRNAEALFRLGV